MIRKYIIVADDSFRGFDEEIAKLEREWGAEEIEPCEDCISRKEVLEYLDKMPSELTSDGRRMVRRRTLEEYISDTLPSVTPKIGKWKQISPQGIYECSVCGQVLMTVDIDCYKYCHGCGVEMG